MATTVILKKYSNRRLYNTETSKYVTLDEVGEMIKSGRQVEIVDAKTKETVTAFVLTQIVLEEARKHNILLPIPVLHQIIQYGDNTLREFFNTYLQQAIQNYLDYKQAFDNQMKQWLNMGMDMSKTLPSVQPLADMMNMFSKSSTGNSSEGPEKDGDED